MNDPIDSTINEIVWSFSKQQPRIFLVFLFFIIGMWLQDIVVPHYTGKVVNAIQGKKPLFTLFITIIVIIVGAQLLNTIADWIDMQIFPQMQFYVQQHMINHVLKVRQDDFAEVDNASIVAKLIKLPYALYAYIDQYRIVIIPSLLIFGVATIYISMTDVYLGVLLFIAFVAIIFILMRSPKLCQGISQESEVYATQMANEIDDMFNNLITVFSQNTEGEELQRLDRVHKLYEDQVIKALQCVFSVKLSIFPIIIAFLCLFVWRCYVLVSKKRITAGKFVALFMIMGYLSNNLWRLNNQVKETAPRYGRIREFMGIYKLENEKRQQVEGARTSVNADNSRGIFIDHLTFRYPNTNISILDDVTLFIPTGETLAIMGRIGSGKSTIVKLLMKYYIPDSGEIFWNGKSYSSMRPDEVRSRVGYVNQSPILFNRTIYENIVYGLSQKISHADIYKILDEAGIRDIFGNLPNGLGTNVGRKGSKLSGGQRQIVWLLRVYLNNPELLILDEPTASIDDITKDAVYNLLNIVMKDKTTIIITHDSFFKDKVDRTITMKNGMITGDTQASHHSLLW